MYRQRCSKEALYVVQSAVPCLAVGMAGWSKSLRAALLNTNSGILRHCDRYEGR
jgi:hypothetical protein